MFSQTAVAPKCNSIPIWRVVIMRIVTIGQFCAIITIADVHIFTKSGHKVTALARACELHLIKCPLFTEYSDYI